MHAAPPQAKSPLISFYSSQKYLAKISVGFSTKRLQFIFTVDEWMLYPLSISPCQPLHAVGYPFDCPNIVCLISFPNINQNLIQNYLSQPEKISRYPKENEPEVFLNTCPYTNLANNVMTAYLVIWWPWP